MNPNRRNNSESSERVHPRCRCLGRLVGWAVLLDELRLALVGEDGAEVSSATPFGSRG
jgi:hypothetical protein